MYIITFIYPIYPVNHKEIGCIVLCLSSSDGLIYRQRAALKWTKQLIYFHGECFLKNNMISEFNMMYIYTYTYIYVHVYVFIYV